MKKKTKSKEVQKKPEPQKIKVRFESDRLIFELGDKQFFMSDGQASALFGRSTQSEFERLKAEEREDFSDLAEVDFAAKYHVVYEHFRNLPATAKFLKMDEGRLRRWMNFSATSNLKHFRRFSQGESRPQYEMLVKKYKDELFPEKEEKEKGPFMPHQNKVEKIASLFMDGLGPREVAKNMGIDYEIFSKWYLSGEAQRKVTTAMNNIKVDPRMKARIGR
ncbi:MAG: hypothetical protein HQ555_07805 [Candidatus Aminicenantes bacterium]|nr:hypothetical protein [Candidatus Aminicenantes bacterium]